VAIMRPVMPLFAASLPSSAAVAPGQTASRKPTAR
jgi:hypothetical protein